MAEEELETVGLQDNFYRDGLTKVIFIIVSFLIALGLLIALSVYLYVKIPPPITFPTDNEWRVQPSIPLDQPYLSDPDMLQWVSDTIQKVLMLDFYRYNDELKVAMPYFTAEGWKIFLNQLNNYANYNNVQKYRMFVNAKPIGAPNIWNRGLLSGRYAWWVLMPIQLNYTGGTQELPRNLNLQLLIVRVPTLNNLSGIAIDNIVVENSKESSPLISG